MARRVQDIQRFRRSAIAVFLMVCPLWKETAASATGWNHVPKHTAGWNYVPGDAVGPENWYLKYPDCRGRMQSPININTSQVVYDGILQPFDFSDYGITDNVQLKLENLGGHTAEVMFFGRELFLKGGSLPDAYKLEQVHFHWGINGSRGSEHNINGRTYSLEAHFVHRQGSLPNMTVAAPHPFGLAVVGLLFEEGKQNDKYEQILKYFDEIRNVDAVVDIPTFAIKDLLPSTNFDYYRYYGSLTTPPCYESVIWSMAVNTVEISREQMARFRSLCDNDNNPLVDDYRPIQPLNQRTVTTTKK